MSSITAVLNLPQTKKHKKKKKNIEKHSVNTFNYNIIYVGFKNFFVIHISIALMHFPLYFS